MGPPGGTGKTTENLDRGAVICTRGTRNWLNLGFCTAGEDDQKEGQEPGNVHSSLFQHNDLQEGKPNRHAG
jgi:hypothetical protein